MWEKYVKNKHKWSIAKTESIIAITVENIKYGPILSQLADWFSGFLLRGLSLKN